MENKMSDVKFPEVKVKLVVEDDDEEFLNTEGENDLQDSFTKRPE
jgi:hypothetical protein